MRCKTVSVLCCRALPFMTLFGLLTIVGCGGGGSTATGEVSGTVFIKGKPLAEGGLAFLSEDGRTSAAPVKDGNYSAKGVPTGKLKVGVQVAGYTDVVTSNPHAKGVSAMMQKAKEMGAKVESSSGTKKEGGGPKIAAKYNNPDKSGFEFELKPGEKKNFNIEIP